MNFNRFISIFAVLLYSYMTASAVLASEPSPPSALKLTRFLDDLYRSSSSIGKIEIHVKSKTQERHLKIRMWTKGAKKALIVIDDPARESGTATLKVDNNMWNYFPKISRTIRIPPSLMLSQWMGTDFTNDDLVKDSSYEQDFESDVDGPSQDPKGWRLIMTAKKGVVGRWQKIEVVVDDDSLPVIAHYFDQKGRLARTFRYSEVKQMGGRRIPTHINLKLEDQSSHETDLRYLDMKFDVNLPESTFNLSQLEKQ